MNWRSLKRDKTLDEHELIIKAKSGDSAARELLFKNNIPYMMILADKWRNTTDIQVEYEELVGMFTLEMQKAYDKFDVNKNLKFVTFMKTYINNRMLNLIRENRRIKNSKYEKVSMDFALCDDENLHKKVSNENVLDVSSFATNNVFMKDLLSKFYNVATNKEKTIFRKVYFENKILEVVANEIGSSRSSVGRVHCKILAKFREIAAV